MICIQRTCEEKHHKQKQTKNLREFADVIGSGGGRVSHPNYPMVMGAFNTGFLHSLQVY